MRAVHQRVLRPPRQRGSGGSGGCEAPAGEELPLTLLVEGAVHVHGGESVRVTGDIAGSLLLHDTMVLYRS